MLPLPRVGRPLPLRRSAALVARSADIWIAIAAALLFVPGLGSVHLFDRDEINFAEIAREMLVTGQSVAAERRLSPLLREAAALHVASGRQHVRSSASGEFAARLPNALCGALTLVVLYRIGARIRGRTFGLLWVLAYAGSSCPTPISAAASSIRGSTCSSSSGSVRSSAARTSLVVATPRSAGSSSVSPR